MSMRVEVIYALPRKQERIVLDLPRHSTVLDAVQASGLLLRLPPLEHGCLGIWGRAVTPETRLRDRDRVEIYRRLLADPKVVRRARAEKARK